MPQSYELVFVVAVSEKQSFQFMCIILNAIYRQIINCILVLIGVILSGVIFHVGTKEPKNAKARGVC